MGIHARDLFLLDSVLPGWKEGRIALLGSQNLRNPHRPFSVYAEEEGLDYVGFDINEEDGCTR